MFLYKCYLVTSAKIGQNVERRKSLHLYFD